MSIPGSHDQLHNVFVYGSFQEPDVINVMFNRTPEIISATLPGFQRFKLKGRLYPCIAPSEKGEIHGKRFGELVDVDMVITSDEFENLDAVQGNEFERVTVGVVRNDNSEKMPVKTYIWINKDDPDMCGEWDFEEWKRLHMNKFIESFKKIMDRKKNPNGKGKDDFSHVLRKDLSDEIPSSGSNGFVF